MNPSPEHEQAEQNLQRIARRNSGFPEARL